MIQSVNKYHIYEILSSDGNFYYTIPKYQREYTWSYREWEALYDDISENNDEYFIGSIICIPLGDAINPYLEVIDGQQRLTTISLFLTAIYTRLKEHRESLSEDDEDVLETMEAVLSEGYDVVGIDSHVVAQGLIAENLGITMKRAENRLLKMMKNQMLGNNARRLMTSFINIQQMVKSGDFAGTMALQHAVDATMELRLEKRNNINSDRYIVFSKHRRGTPFQKLYFSLAGVDGSVAFDEDRFKRDQMAQKIQEENRQNLRDAADAFDNLFNQNSIDEQ